MEHWTTCKPTTSMRSQRCALRSPSRILEILPQRHIFVSALCVPKMPSRSSACNVRCQEPQQLGLAEIGVKNHAMNSHFDSSQAHNWCSGYVLGGTQCTVKHCDGNQTNTQPQMRRSRRRLPHSPQMQHAIQNRAVQCPTSLLRNSKDDVGNRALLFRCSAHLSLLRVLRPSNK